MVKTTTKPRHKASSHHSAHIHHTNDNLSNIAIGAAVGCVIGTAAALLFARRQPKKNKLSQAFETVTHSLNGIKKDYAEDAFERGQKLYNQAKDSASHVYDTASHVFTKRDSSSVRNLVLGIAGAALLGASTVYALSQQGELGEHREGFFERLKSHHWTDLARLAVDAVSHKLHEVEEEYEHHNPLRTAIDWAMVGVNLWNEIKKGDRR